MLRYSCIDQPTDEFWYPIQIQTPQGLKAGHGKFIQRHGKWKILGDREGTVYAWHDMPDKPVPGVDYIDPRTIIDYDHWDA